MGGGGVGDGASANLQTSFFHETPSKPSSSKRPTETVAEGHLEITHSPRKILNNRRETKRVNLTNLSLHPGARASTPLSGH